MNNHVHSLRSKRFRAVSEQRKTEERDLGFGRARNETRGKKWKRGEGAIFRAAFAPKQHGNACYAGYHVHVNEEPSVTHSQSSKFSRVFTQRFFAQTRTKIACKAGVLLFWYEFSADILDSETNRGLRRVKKIAFSERRTVWNGSWGKGRGEKCGVL